MEAENQVVQVLIKEKPEVVSRNCENGKALLLPDITISFSILMVVFSVHVTPFSAAIFITHLIFC